MISDHQKRKEGQAVNAITAEGQAKRAQADALALRAEEGRDKLRKAAGGAISLDPRMSEWGNPAEQTSVIHA